MLIDGGKAQLNFAYEAIKELGLADSIDVIALAKKFEEIYTLHSKNPIRIKKTDPHLKLFQRIRDESHRFAVTYQRKKRQKESTTSILTTIYGLGEKRIERLYSHFQTIEVISKSSVTEISKIANISKELALTIKKTLQSQK